MAVKYDFFKIPDPDKKGKVGYSARTVLDGDIDILKIADIVASRCTMKQGDVLGVWDSMLRVIKQELENGKRVHLNGLCYMNLSAYSSIVQSQNEIRSESIICKDIKYRTEKRVKESLRKVTFERKHACHSSTISLIEIDNMLGEYFKHNKYISRKEFSRLCELSSSTAIRKIKELVKEGKLEYPGSRNSGLYFPVPGKYVSVTTLKESDTI